MYIHATTALTKISCGSRCHAALDIAVSESVHYDYFFDDIFQAEDGIRDLVRSRGLGDVYKRQTKYRFPGHRYQWFWL